MRAPITAAVALALGLGCAGPAFAKSSGTPHCAPGDPVVMVDMTTKTYVLDRPLAAVPNSSPGHLVTPGSASSQGAMGSPEPMAMTSPAAMTSPMAMTSPGAMTSSNDPMQRMCESKAGMMGMNPASGPPPTQQ